MERFELTKLWARTLASKKKNDPQGAARDKLRNAYIGFRSKIKPIAESIAKDAPNFTVHDITHLDALWEYADLVGGPDLDFTPAEAFVLGCAFLIHDIGMGLAAYPRGLAEVKETPVWLEVRAMFVRRSRAAGNSGADDVDEEQVLEEVLRRLHAMHASKIPGLEWRSSGSSPGIRLLDDSELCEAYGETIGRIAESHWWSTEKLGREFANVQGPPGIMPPEWTVDPLKVAALLRLADFAHLDDRRAPALREALQRPSGVSKHHWTFQKKLNQATSDGDRLAYTSKSAFSKSESDAWWLCHETMLALSSELAAVDALLFDKGRPRFLARAVSHVDSVMRFAEVVKVNGWRPIDARVRISNVAGLVSTLGGAALYGNRPSIPLRELIQNASDAIRARRALEQRGADWGAITIQFGGKPGSEWLQVEDTGVGMSERVLCSVLLDFGTTFWSSPLLSDELPGLASTDFQPVGKFGIGFFSVFMIGERVEVTSRRFDSGRAQTNVLEISDGPASRPLLRPALPEEQLTDGGTKIKIWLRKDITIASFAESPFSRKPADIIPALGRLAPTLPVDLHYRDQTGKVLRVIVANDWQTMPSLQLLERLWYRPGGEPIDESDTPLTRIPELTPIRSENGTLLGRATLYKAQNYYSDYSAGMVTVGGLRATGLLGICGVIIGEAYTADRELAMPTPDLKTMQAWVKSEVDRRLSESHSTELLYGIADVVEALDSEVDNLPCANSANGFLDVNGIAAFAKDLTEILICHDSSAQLAGGDFADAELLSNVLSCSVGRMDVLYNRHTSAPPWPRRKRERLLGEELGELEFYMHSTVRWVLRGIAKGWNTTLDGVLRMILVAKSDDRPIRLFEHDREYCAVAGKLIKGNVIVIKRTE